MQLTPIALITTVITDNTLYAVDIILLLPVSLVDARGSPTTYTHFLQGTTGYCIYDFDRTQVRELVRTLFDDAL